MKFEVYRIKGSERSNKSISDTIRTDGNHSTFECKRVFYEFADGMDLSQYREIIEVPKDKLKVHECLRMNFNYCIYHRPALSLGCSCINCNCKGRKCSAKVRGLIQLQRLVFFYIIVCKEY